jgi:hypothetical protein
MPIVTLDPTFNTSGLMTFSNGNLTVTQGVSNANEGTRATAFITTGKLYFEITISNVTASQGAGVGIGNANISRAGFLGGTAGGHTYLASGAVYTGGGSIATLPVYGTGAVLCVAADIGSQKIWYRVNGGNWNNTTDNPATNAGGYSIAALISNNGNIYPAINLYAILDQVTANLGATAFAQAVPAGFSGISTAPSSPQARIMVMA